MTTNRSGRRRRQKRAKRRRWFRNNRSYIEGSFGGVGFRIGLSDAVLDFTAAVATMLGFTDGKTPGHPAPHLNAAPTHAIGD